MAEKISEKKMSFEKALERLEAIVADMESGKLGLEKMMESFEEGSKLVQFCTQKLNEVERKIEILVKKGGEVVAQPFEMKEGESPADAE
ncbi:MAG: exodeoxyribonuclease VII small subunit [Lentisphaerota bacterium]